MKKYLAVIRIGYISVLENRWQILIANLQAVFTLFVLFYFWKAVFVNQTTIRGYTFSQIITYYFLIRITYNRVSAFGANIMAKNIKNGDITKNLVRPYDFTWYHVCLFFTRATLWTFGNLLAISIFSIYLYQNLVAPPNAIYWILFFIVYILNGLLSIGINLNIGYIAFWIGEVTHLKIVSTVIITICSGGLIPLAFFPQWSQNILKYLPFKYLVQFPTDIYFGKLNIFDSIWGIGILFGWVVFMFVLADYLLRRGLKIYESYN